MVSVFVPLHRYIRYLLGLTADKFGEANNRRQPNGKEGNQGQTDICTKRINHEEEEEEDANNGLTNYPDSSMASNSYFESMLSEWDLALGSEISNWEYWDRLLKDYQPGQLAE